MSPLESPLNEQNSPDEENIKLIKCLQFCSTFKNYKCSWEKIICAELKQSLIIKLHFILVHICNTYNYVNSVFALCFLYSGVHYINLNANGSLILVLRFLYINGQDIKFK